MAKNKITTIKIEENTKKRIDQLKEYKMETYNEVLNKMINIINITIRNPVAGARIFRGIKRKKMGKEKLIERFKGELEEEFDSEKVGEKKI
jgi:hypothetical protein